jgi:hypothetical protein
MIDEEEVEELQIEQASMALTSSITLPVPAPVVVVICEPRGLSNLITRGIKTSKTKWVWNG